MRVLGNPLFSGPGPDPVRADRLRPGTAVRNPLGQEPWVLDLLDVGIPDAEAMVTLTAVQASVRVAADWPVHLYTAADAGVEAGVLAAELDRQHLDRHRRRRCRVIRRAARIAGAGVLAVGLVAGLLAGLRLLAVTAPDLVGVPTSTVRSSAPPAPGPPVALPPRPRVPGPWIVADHGAMSCCDTSGRPLDPPVPTVRCLSEAEYRAAPRPAHPHYWVIPLKGSVPDPADSPDDSPFIPGEACPSET